MLDAAARVLAPTGLSLAIFVVSIICLVLSAIAVSLRVYVRCSEKTFGWDDGLILAGLVSFFSLPPRFILRSYITIAASSLGPGLIGNQDVPG